MTMKGKARKKGDWVAVARGRGGREREIPQRGSALGVNLPRSGDVGSAAYRRTLAGANGGRKTLGKR